MNKEDAYEALRLQIVTNRVAPGSILNERDLMARLSIGRSPLREVLFRLQEENLIKPLPRLGYMVSAVDISEVRALVELRRELEGFAGQLAARRITAGQLESLRRIIAEEETKKPDEVAEVFSIGRYFDTRFHHLLYQAAGNRKLVKVLEDLHIVMLRIWFHVGLGAVDFSRHAVNVHALLEALDGPDPQRGGAAMEAHVDLFADQVRERFV